MTTRAAPLVLAINPGSTSTKLAVYQGEECLFAEDIAHSRADMSRFKCVADQYEFRRGLLYEFLERKGCRAGDFAAVIGRGGLTPPIAGGVYAINARMLADLREAKCGDHPSNLGAPLADELGRQNNCPAFIMDPPVVDELWEIARFSGLPEMPRASIFHALSQRAAARKAAREMGLQYESANFIVAHLGGGISVGAHRQGRVVDVNNALHGEGPFSPERTGSLPACDVARLCLSGKTTLPEFTRMITRAGGLLAHLGTNDGRAIERRIDAGDTRAAQVYEAMAYQIAKEIGGLAAALSGKADAVVLTGGLARSQRVVELIRKYAGFVAPFKVYPEMEEMCALAGGALAALQKRVPVQEYRC